MLAFSYYFLFWLSHMERIWVQPSNSPCPRDATMKDLPSMTPQCGTIQLTKQFIKYLFTHSFAHIDISVCQATHRHTYKERLKIYELNDNQITMLDRFYWYFHVYSHYLLNKVMSSLTWFSRFQVMTILIMLWWIRPRAFNLIIIFLTWRLLFSIPSKHLLWVKKSQGIA